jgi:hypothetical protein
MADPVCAVCSKPILPTEDESIVQQVDACTLAAEHVAYHSTCWERKRAENDAMPGRGGAASRRQQGPRGV